LKAIVEGCRNTDERYNNGGTTTEGTIIKKRGSVATWPILGYKNSGKGERNGAKKKLDKIISIWDLHLAATRPHLSNANRKCGGHGSECNFSWQCHKGRHD
jgi:hypothetical protein